jgi:XTP/dITP diphosphohydrolase
LRRREELERFFMTTLIISTRNEHKLEEIRAIVSPSFKIRTWRDFGEVPEVIEDAETFAGNAVKKGVETANWIASGDWGGVRGEDGEGFYVLADDSGLEVDVLQGAPGVRSARFAGEGEGNSPDEANNTKLLEMLKEVSWEDRRARFRCVIALTRVPGPIREEALPVGYRSRVDPELFEGHCEGRIGFAPRGRGGFGYDPLFIPEGFEESFAELGEEIKNRISHRARALEKLRARLDQDL